MKLSWKTCLLSDLRRCPGGEALPKSLRSGLAPVKFLPLSDAYPVQSLSKVPLQSIASSLLNNCKDDDVRLNQASARFVSFRVGVCWRWRCSQRAARGVVGTIAVFFGCRCG